MIFCGLDVNLGDMVVIDIVDSRSPMTHIVTGQVDKLGDKTIVIRSEDRKFVIHPVGVKRIALFNEDPPLLINI